MAYTRVWDNAAPPGAALANTIDTIFNQFREDTQQRISSILMPGTDIDDDPLQLNPANIGGGAGIAKIRGVNPFQVLSGTGYALSTAAIDVAGPIQFIPSGASLTRIIHYVKNGGIPGANFDLQQTDVTTGITVPISTTSLAGTIAFSAVDSGVFGVPILITDVIQLQVRWQAPALNYRYYGCRIFYTIPNFASLG